MLSSMSISGIQGFPLQVTVTGCYNLDDKEWLSRQDPYVSLEYGGAKYRTKTCTDGGRNPTFQETFIFTLIEGLRELSISVWNNRTFSADEHIGTGRVQLQKVLSQGYDDSCWTLHGKTGRHSGEVRLILHYSNANDQPKAQLYASGSQFAAPPTAMSQLLPYNQFPPAPVAYYPATYPPSPYVATPPAGYPPQACPPAGYPPQAYPLPTQAPGFFPTGPSGVYPPPPSSSGIYPPPPY